MKKYFLRTALIATALALGAIQTATASAARETLVAEARPQPASPPAQLEFRGNIVKIDNLTDSFTVARWPVTRTFTLAPACEITTPDKQAGSMDDLKVGDPVRITYENIRGSDVARRINACGKAFARQHDRQLEQLQQMLYPSPND